MLTTSQSPPPRVDYHAKRYFLTYSQCDIEKELLRDFLVNDKGVKWYIIGKEAHKDGGKHLHAYVEYTEQRRVRDARYFDYGGFHPNIETVRVPAKCQAYCVKDGDYIANMEIAEGKRTYGTIIQGASSAQEFLVQVEDAYPRDMVLNLERIKTYANWKFGEDRNTYTSEFSSFVAPEVLSNWYEDNVYTRQAGR